MKRTGILIAAALLLLLPLMFAQDTTWQPSRPTLPADVLGPQLIAWSQLQKPHPVPQPLPPPDRPDQANQEQPGPPTSSQAQQTQPESPTQIFTGTIVKNAGKYVLKVTENLAYQIEDQEKAEPYEGKQVKISGSLDERSNMLRITTIELIS